MKKTIMALTALALVLVTASTASAQMSIPLPGGVKIKPNGKIVLPRTMPSIPAQRSLPRPIKQGPALDEASLLSPDADYGTDLPSTTPRYPLVGDIQVAVGGRYPSGYRPRWAVAGDGQYVNLKFESYSTRNPSEGGQRHNFQLTMLDGQPVLVFDSAIGRRCAADLTGGGRLIANRPIVFHLANFRTTGSQSVANCPMANRYTRSWSGGLSLRVDGEGHLYANVVLQRYDDTGRATSVLTARDAKLTNGVTPMAARQDAGLELPRVDTQGLKIIDILDRGQFESARGNWPRARAYFAAAAAQGDVQGMAALGYTYGKDVPQAVNPERERYWCAQAYAGALRSKINHELEAVNFFCPKPLIASLTKTDAERRRNAAASARADAEYQANKAKATAAARAMISSAVAEGLRPSGGGEDGLAEHEFDKKAEARGRVGTIYEQTGDRDPQ